MLVGVDTIAVDVDVVCVVETDGVEAGVVLVDGEIVEVVLVGVVPVG